MSRLRVIGMSCVAVSAPYRKKKHTTDTPLGSVFVAPRLHRHPKPTGTTRNHGQAGA
jgi:hypothetical protein